MKASTIRKGLKPLGYVAARVTFDNSTSGKLYTYWVPYHWDVRPGDKLEVTVSDSHSENKWTTVRELHTAGFVGQEHKCAVSHDDRVYRMANPSGLLTPAKIRTSAENLAPALAQKEPAAMIKMETYLNGKPIKQASDAEMFDAIRKTEAEIKGLSEIVNKPKALKERMVELQADIDGLVKYMDER